MHFLTKKNSLEPFGKANLLVLDFKDNEYKRINLLKPKKINLTNI